MDIDTLESQKILGKFRIIFNEEQEEELLNHLFELEERFYGVSISDLRR